MTNFKVNINVSFYYGGWHLFFGKSFLLPFAPFYDLEIDEEDNTIELKNNDYCKTIISFNPTTDEFDIDNRNIWKNPVTDETIDYIIEQFKNTGWERKDNTNVEELKKLMYANYEREKKIHKIFTGFDIK